MSPWWIRRNRELKFEILMMGLGGWMGLKEAGRMSMGAQFLVCTGCREMEGAKIVLYR